MSTAQRRGNGEGSTPVQRKDGRWQVSIRYIDSSGVAKRTSVTARTAKDVRARAKDIRKRLSEGLPAKDRKVTVAAFAAEWIEAGLAASDRKPSTKALYATLVRKHVIGSTIGTIPLDRLKPSRVQAWTKELGDSGLSQSTVRSTYTVLRAVLDAAVVDGDLGRNPAAAVKRPKVTQAEARYLGAGQVRTLLQRAQGSRYAPLFELLVNTGMRRGEALALTWRDVDFAARVIHVRGTLARVDGELMVTEPKTAKSKRAIHLSDTCEHLLKSVRLRQREERLAAGSAWVPTPYVFTTEHGAPCDPRNALRALKAAAKAADLPGIGLHTLRHSAATVMIERGVPLKVVSEVLGHGSVSITGDIYAHVSPNVAADAIDVLGAALGA